MGERILSEECQSKDPSNSCNITNLITDRKPLKISAEGGLVTSLLTKDQSIRQVELPTIKENQEGFYYGTSCVRSLVLQRGGKRRNSHPISAHDFNMNLSPYISDAKSTSTVGGKTGLNCKDPMLAFDINIIRKSQNATFKKHKLDKIDEAEDSAEHKAEEDFRSIKEQSISSECFNGGDAFQIRRSSFPNTDQRISAYKRHFRQLLM